MEYINVHDMSLKWNMKERKVTSLCREGRIKGSKKIGNEWLIPSDSIKPIDKRTKEFDNNNISYSNSSDKVITYYKNKYKKESKFYSFTPYRICPIGAHVDHNLGKITGFAINKGIHIAYDIKENGIIELESLQFPKRAQFHCLNVPEKQYDWADHLRGATIELGKRYNLKKGMSAIIDGELPIGGLSSSAALIITYLNALSFLNNIELTEEELIEISCLAENNYVGVNCGKLDQSVEIYSNKNHLLFIDLKNNKRELIENKANFKIGIFFSGLERSLESTKYNNKVEELRIGAYLLNCYEGIENNLLNNTNMIDIDYKIYLKHKDKLPINIRKRIEHFYSENKRVEEGIKYFKKGDIKSFGKLINESGLSSINNWETGSKELISLCNILRNIKGVYGTRFSGAGFKGCCLALIDPKYEKEIEKEVRYLYLKEYPNLENKYSSFIVETSDGVKL